MKPFNSNLRVTVRMMEGHRTLRYRYDVNEYMSFDVSLLSEVGQPWQAAAEAAAQVIAANEGASIQTGELKAAPWYVDALVKI
jgi:hypothetical protein